MTREFINRILSQLIEHKIEYVVTGSVSKYLRGIPVATMDLDIVVQTNSRNLENIDHLKNENQFVGSKISDELNKGKIVRIKSFPFRFDLLPRLDGLSNKEIFNNKDLVKFGDKTVPIISETDLARNYQSFKQYESN